MEGHKFPHNHQKLGKALGLSRNAGSALSQWILTSTEDVMPIQTLRRLTNAEYNNESIKQRMSDFNTKVKHKLGDSLKAAVIEPIANSYPEYDDELYEGLYGEESSTLPDDDTFDNHDLLINAEAILPYDGGHMQAARIINRCKNDGGTFIGTYNENLILDT